MELTKRQRFVCKTVLDTVAIGSGVFFMPASILLGAIYGAAEQIRATSKSVRFAHTFVNNGLEKPTP